MAQPTTIRTARADDHREIVAAVGQWWEGRDLRPMLQGLFLEHFAGTSLVAQDDQGLAGFLVGFCSSDHEDEAYAHFLGVRPDLRGQGLGRELHDRFAAARAAEGRPVVRCVTGQVNQQSVAFHTAIGFVVDAVDEGEPMLVHLSRHTASPGFVPRTDARAHDDPWPTASWPPPQDTVLRGRTVELALSDPSSDAEGMFSALDDEAVWAHVAGRPGDADAMATLIRWKLDEPSWWPWTVRLREPLGGFGAGQIVGTTSFLDLAPGDARGEIGSTTYAPSVWASDVNPECKLLLLEYAFEEAGFGRVQFKTDVRNHRSQRAIARLGASYEGVLRRFQRRSDGSVRDTVLFSITAEQWPDVREGLLGRLRTT